MMKRNTLVMHIGTNKTGTSALQRFLRENQKYLRRQGWDYPALSITGTIIPKLRSDKNGGIFLCAYRNKFGKIKKGIIWLIIKNCLRKRNVIISEEGIWSKFGKDLESEIRDYKKRHADLKVVCYIRRQDLYLESAWNQKIKSGMSCLDMKDFFESEKECFDYKKRLDMIADVVGKENLIVRVYENSQFVDGDITKDFLYINGIELDSENVQQVKNVNDRLDGDAVAVKKIFNQYYDGWNSVRMPFIDRYLIEEFNAESQKVGYISSENRKKILEFYKEDNEYIAKEYLGREDGVLFKNNNIDIPFYKKDLSIREEKIIKVFAKLIEKEEKVIPKGVYTFFKKLKELNK